MNFAAWQNSLIAVCAASGGEVEITMPAYDSIASVYDNINSEIDYSAWADFIEECFKTYLKEKPELVLDLACGTGSMTLELARRGFETIGVDGSPAMLAEAQQKAMEAGENILFLCQK